MSTVLKVWLFLRFEIIHQVKGQHNVAAAVIVVSTTACICRCWCGETKRSLQICSVDVKGVFFGVITDVSSSVSVKEFQLKGERNLGGVELSVWQLYPNNPPTQ